MRLSTRSRRSSKPLAMTAPQQRPMWPMIVLRTPKGWTGPAIVDGQQVEGTWRSHQVPLAETRTNPEHRKQLEEWLRSYNPEETLRRRRSTARRPSSSGSRRQPQDERQPARQRRSIAP